MQQEIDVDHLGLFGVDSKRVTETILIQVINFSSFLKLKTVCYYLVGCVASRYAQIERQGCGDAGIPDRHVWLLGRFNRHIL